MKGTISRIDYASGRLELATAKGSVHAYFVPETIKEFKVGDKVEVAMELDQAPANAGAAYERDMQERFPTTTPPDEDMAKKSKQVGS